MADPQIEVVFQSRYESDLAKQLRNEQRRMDAMQKWLDSHPLQIRYRIDVNGIKQQVAQAKAAAYGELAKGGAPAILGADGLPAVKSTVKELSKVQGLLGEISRTTFDKDGNATGRYLQQIEQIGNGLQRISNFKMGEDGRFQITSEVEKDVRTVKQLEDGLRAVNKQLGQQYAAAKGRGDKAGQLDALRQQKAEVDKLVSEAAAGGLVGSSAYARAESQQDRLASRISGMEGQMYSEAEKKARSSRSQEIARQIKAEEARATAALKANKIEADHAERLLPDRAAYEKEINRIYQERRRIFEQSRDFFQQMDKALLLENRPDLANKAFNRGLNADSQINQSDLDYQRAVTDSMRAGAKVAEREGAKQLKADVERAQKEAKEREAQGQKQLRADVEAGQRRIREKAAADRAARESAFRQEMQDIKAHSDKRIAQINRDEQRAVRAATNSEQRRAARQLGSNLRQSEYGDLAGRYLALESRMRSAGFVEQADQVRGRALGAGVSAERDMARFEAATRKSGHALDFHSSSLLRNAGTFLRWQIPMQAVMSIQRAFMAGVEQAIRVDRQFATLQTVFQGTAEDARRLKEETLDLAVAQGRSAEEAMDSAIRWSRLGLTRLQVLEATRVTLMASNVAEIDAAQAAEKLSSIYATYKLNVGDLAGVLNRLNSISNNYNVTVKDLFEGIARVSGVARQAGLELRDLEGIIGAVTGATGRPGQEIGTALKTIITRLGDPKIGEKLKKAFDIDLTGPNGDLKDMSLIMRELADLYPTLNRAEQQRFLMLTAGTRQASRMAQVMTEYRQAQALAAKAGFDHTASLRENEKILQSLQSRIDSFKATWTDLATTIGDAGFMERGGEFLRYLQQIIQAYTARMGEATAQTRDFVIQNAMYAEAVEKLGGGEDKAFGTRSKFDREEVEKTLALLKESKTGFGSKALSFLESRGRSVIDPSQQKAFVGGVNGMKLTSSELEKAIKFYENLLVDNGDTGFSDELRRTTEDVVNLRDELEAIEKSAWVFESLAKSVEEGALDRSGMLRDFQAIANLMLSLPDGQRVYNNAVREYNALLTQGDPAKMAEFLRGISTMFSSAGVDMAPNLESEMSAVSAVLDRQIAELEQRKMKLMEQPPSAENDAEQKKVVDRLKEVRGYVEQVNRVIERSNASAFGAASRSITAYVEDVLAAAKAYGEAFKDFAPDAANDPIERIMQRQNRSLQLGKEMLVEIQRETNRQSDSNRATAGSIADPLQRQRFLDQQDEADQIARSKIDAEDERLEQLRRELDLEQSILRIKREQSDASEAAAMSAAAFRFGETESDKDANQARAAIARARAGINQAGGYWLLGMDNPNQRAAAAGQVLQDEATARAALESMQRRNFEIDAARRQVAFDMAKAMKEQTDEASKQYQLASREDQLRASALARTIRDKGPVKENEFSFLSQNLRNALTTFLPNDAPGLLNPAKAAADKTRRELDEEQRRLVSSISEVSAALGNLALRITKETAAGGSLDVVQGNITTKPLQDAANTRDRGPVVRLDIASVNVQIQLANQIEPIMRAVVQPMIDAGLKDLEGRLRNRPIPNPQSFVE